MKAANDVTVYCCTCGVLIDRPFSIFAHSSSMESGNCYCSNACRVRGYSILRKGIAPKVCSMPISDATRLKHRLLMLGKPSRNNKTGPRSRVALYCCYCGNLVIRRAGDFKKYTRKNGFCYCSNKCRLAMPRRKDWCNAISIARKGWVFPESAKLKLRALAYGRKYPNKDTSIEILMQNALRKNNIYFETHKRIYGLPDIFIKPNIAIFCDGTYFHGDPRKYRGTAILKKGLTAKQLWEKDAQVTVTLELMGYKVLRFWESDIKNSMDFCMSRIIESIKLPVYYTTTSGEIRR